MPEPSPKYMFGSDQKVTITDVVPMKPLVRLSRSDAEYQALVNDMKLRGQKVPIKTRPHPIHELRVQGKLEALDGVGRLQVAIEFGWHEIRADIEDLTDEEAYELAFTLNINRENLTAMSIANWLNVLKLKFGYSGEKLAEISGRSTSWVSRHLSILKTELPEIEQETLNFSIPEPRTERQARVLRRAPPEIRFEAMIEASKIGALPSARELERKIDAKYTPEQVLSRYEGQPSIDDEFLIYVLQEEAGTTLTEAKTLVAEFRAPKRSEKGPKLIIDKPNVWTKLSQYYPIEIIDAVSSITNSENLETLIKYCRRFTQKLFIKTPEQIRQAVLEEFAL